MKFHVTELDTELLSDLFRNKMVDLERLRNPNIGILDAVGRHEAYLEVADQVRVDVLVNNESGQIYAILLFPNDDCHAGFEVTWT